MGESQIHEGVQALKVCSYVYALWKAEPYSHQLMSDLPAPYSLPEYSASTGASEITLRLPGTGATSTSATNTTVSTPVPVKGGSVMFRVRTSRFSKGY